MTMSTNINATPAPVYKGWTIDPVDGVLTHHCGVRAVMSPGRPAQPWALCVPPDLGELDNDAAQAWVAQAQAAFAAFRAGRH